MMLDIHRLDSVALKEKVSCISFAFRATAILIACGRSFNFSDADDIINGALRSNRLGGISGV